MSRIQLFFKNFIAGRKALFKRMGIYLASSLAVFEATNILLEDDSIAHWCESLSYGNISLKSLLTNVFVYLAIGAIIAMLRQNGFSHFSMNIIGTDTKIEIVMGDIFSNEGEIVIPCNTTFAGRDDIISGNSIQKQLIRKIDFPKAEASSNESNDVLFERTVNEALMRPDCQARKLPGQRELAGRMYDVYQYGTIAPVRFPINGKQRNFIVLANAEMIEPDNSFTNGPHLMQSINEMWEQIARVHTRQHTIVVPILGTGCAGLTDKPQQTVARYILRTFADNADRLGIKKLILSIYPKDYLDDKINMEELRCYADYLCRFPDSDFKIQSKKGTEEK